MRATYSILFIVLILALIGCTLLAKRSDRPCRRGVMWLDISLILPLAGSLIRLVTENRTVALIGHYFHYIGIDIVLVALVSFTNTYCQGIGDGNGERKPTVMYLMLTADMNNLKQINDEYGHKAGDLYIRGCCHMICEAFKHSPIFRIGGDEFAVIVQGQDYDERLERLKTLRSEFERSFEQQDTDPWLRCSAAVGMAEHAFDDNSFELVFKRADKAMYEDKKQFKEKYGIIR